MASGSGIDVGTNGVSVSSDSSEGTGTSLKMRVAGVRVRDVPPPIPSSTRVQESTTSATPSAEKQGDKESRFTNFNILKRFTFLATIE